MLVDLSRAARLRELGLHLRVLYIQFSVLPLRLHVELDNLRLNYGFPIAREQPLLPNLQELHIRHPSDDKQDTYPNPQVSPDDACHWFMLLASPSVKVASLFCTGLAPDPILLVARAPSISTLRVELARESGPLTIEPPGRPAGAEWVPNLHAWAQNLSDAMAQWVLTSLIVDGHFFQDPDVIMTVGTVARLQSLRLVRATDSLPWVGLLQMQEAPFQGLKLLDLDWVSIDVATAILSQPEISRAIETLRWKVLDDTEDVEDVAEAFERSWSLEMARAA
ncbi:hypothetical protein RhiLY_08580 [Ceratobasidium sp. AG-Ba]|nr:hypothetical protein RhiLY_08580 [Ceratobasidium sp. AG-Ba]